MKHPPLAFVAFLIVALASPAAGAQPISVQSLSVHLLLSPSGDFSEDISALPGFSSWNFRAIQPLKPNDEEFHSFIVKVRLSSPKEAFQKGAVGRVVVRSVRNGRVVFNSPISSVYIPGTEGAVVAKLVEGNVCEPVVVEASA